MDGRENRIVADHRQRVAKPQAGENEGRLIDRIAICIEGLAQDFELVARGLLGGAPCEADLEKHARVLRLPDAIRPTKPMTRGSRSSTSVSASGRGTRVAAPGCAERPLPLHAEHRLPYGRSTDAELIHQLALGRDLVADGHSSGEDRELDMFGDLFEVSAHGSHNGPARVLKGFCKTRQASGMRLPTPTRNSNAPATGRAIADPSDQSFSTTPAPGDSCYSKLIAPRRRNDWRNRP
jgi:hypothetical protein